ncbi:MAG: DNA polymerase I, partial [Treponema sp.]|nr:DNA polymerase I [Treponema sp.]
DRNAPNPFSENTHEPITVKQNDTSNYKAVTNLQELEAFVSAYLKAAEEKPGIPIALDTETNSLDTLNCQLLGFSLCWEETKAIYIPVQQNSEDLFNQTEYISLKDSLTQIIRLITHDKTLLVMHNAKFDLKVLISQIKAFPELLKLEPQEELSAIKCRLADTMIAAWILNPERLGKNGYSLEYLGETVLGLKGIEFNQIVGKGQTFADVPLEQAAPYGAEDADFTLLLWNNLKKKLDETNKELFLMEMDVLPVLTQMEITGIHLDSQNLYDYNVELAQGLAQVEQEIYKTVGHEFNIASPKQLQTVLFEELKLPSGKKTKTGYSTDTSVLEELATLNPVPKMILEYRELAKLQSTYVETLPKLTDSNGRIHTDFVQTGTATGRLSCREPNLQNIPVRSEAGRKIRSAFTAPKGKVLISADYAQIELVVLAHLSKDPKMCESFIKGTDVHKATAAMIYGVEPEAVTPEMRRTAKTINFGVIYGMSAFRLAQDLGITRTQASMFIDNYFRMYSNINSFIHNTVISAEEKGYVETVYGRKRPILNINSKNKIEKSAAERIAVNSPVQGSAADIVKKAMLNVVRGLKASGSKARLLLQVHDELIFECPDDKESIELTLNIIKERMETAVALEVPLRVSIETGKCWGEFH